jgi:predicted RNA-binding Zn ribbon-like protein
MNRSAARRIFGAPALALAALVGLAAMSAGWAYAPWAPAKTEASLAFAVAMLAVVVIVFMDFRRSGALVRLCALTGCVWLSFLFFQTLGEILSR